MVCTNPDLFAHEGSPPRAVVRQGSIAKLYEELGGEVFYIGKPYKTAYETALRNFATKGITNPADILMVDDTPETDIRGANSLGLASALTCKTGIMAERINGYSIAESVEKLPLTDRPRYLIERL